MLLRQVLFIISYNDKLEIQQKVLNVQNDSAHLKAMTIYSTNLDHVSVLYNFLFFQIIMVTVTIICTYDAAL